LAEDSNFFCKQVANFLKDDGYDVVACEDGLVAWNALQGREKHIDLVVTDLEMPNMNGFELARRIRDDPEFTHLPIIALTSLAGEEDIRRGKESGIDDYQIKLDREKLLESVAGHLRKVLQSKNTNATFAAAAACGIHDGGQL
jgi:two-component system, chemotaxis family, sensor kinase CheA